MKLLLAAFIAVRLASAFEVTSTTNSQVPSSDTVDYVCLFQNSWSATNHPALYPGGAHWSPPVLVAHGEEYTMWENGGLASPGVEDVAETGSTSELQGELASAADVGSVVQGGSLFPSNTQTQTFDPVTMSPDSRFFSTITMIAPSPDWFSGFYNFDAVNEASGTWYQEFVIDTFPWDAGTEEGDEYDGNNPATDPHQPIFRFTPDTIPSTGVFLNSAGDDILPVITWTCSLQQQEPDTSTPPVPETVAPAPIMAAPVSAAPVTVAPIMASPITTAPVTASPVMSAPGPSFEVTSTTDSEVSSSDAVDYVCIFQNSWSGTNHPALYPENAMWSPPVLVAHGQGYTMWENGGMASPGVEDVAETGSPALLQDELATASDVGFVVTGMPTFNSDTQTQTFDPVSMSPSSTYFSTISMVAPSPDWFSGFYNFNAVNEESGTWYQEFAIDTFPWDAGTEDGETYSGDNPATDPHQPIFRFTPDTIPSTGVFLNSAGDDILPVITWTCTLQQQEPDTSTVPAPETDATTPAAVTEATTPVATEATTLEAVTDMPESDATTVAATEATTLEAVTDMPEADAPLDAPEQDNIPPSPPDMDDEGPPSCDNVSCADGTRCEIRSSVAQCFPIGEYVPPLWWDRISATFVGIGGSLKNCSRRRGVTPINGSMCARRPKTCYFGNQDCPTVGPHPETICVCDPPIGEFGMWQCSDSVCPASSV